MESAQRNMYGFLIDTKTQDQLVLQEYILLLALSFFTKRKYDDVYHSQQFFQSSN